MRDAFLVFFGILAWTFLAMPTTLVTSGIKSVRNIWKGKTKNIKPRK